MSELYQVEELNDHLYRIIDAGKVCCYLAVGERRAALLDTCNGYGDIRKVVRELTDRETFVILSHGHLDHIGGAALFPEVYMNPADEPILREHSAHGFRMENAKRLIEAGTLRREDVMSCEGLAPRPLEAHELFDLGGLTIEMLPLKGHTPGMMCPLLRESREIIFGDACGNAILLMEEYSSTVSEYRSALLGMKAQEERYDVVYRNHGSFVSQKSVLDNVIECCDLILAHRDAHAPAKVHGRDMFSAYRAVGSKRLDGKEGNIFYVDEKAR